MSWIENVKAKIFPLSSEQKSLKGAMKEWKFIEMIDNLEANQVCDLCNHRPIRYKFLIKNTITYNTLYVGSECILKFEDNEYILQDEEGNNVDNTILKSAKNTALKKMLLNYLESIDGKFIDGEEFDATTVINIIETDKEISPRMAPMFSKPYKCADADNQKIMKKFIKINLRKKKNKEQLEEIKNTPKEYWKIKIIKCFLSPAQKKRFSL